ncbi:MULTISPECIES: cupin domain-containing protein [unclassified Microbacterium]|uniref:cupin domain-containing protein n=1 Tax=unclassified Microbacterium TaxID=2609290 RepID=UPI001604EAF1|nr:MULTISPECIES: cupin domain-containing protein [unclassified Microbacterium]QNA93636.1 cupin domain-containing protein [Microbacterium sp. Se63.02b]QYM63897.1 cupin domain-containing protein [Microbacterium sp. Se5.02b]
MTGLAAGAGVDATTLVLSHEPLPADEVVDGAPMTAAHTLSTLGGVEVGIWEMTPGTATDTEADEVFVVLSGRATIAFTSSGLPDLEVGPGSVVRLAEGMRTTWTVTETLRKVYIA